MDAQAHLLELVRAVQGEFESTLTKLNQSGTADFFKESVGEVSLAFSDYKGLVRANFLAIDTARSELLERKKEVDDQHLQLQNLLYHKDHLQRSIKALQDYPLQALRQVEEEAGSDQQPLLEGDIGAVKPASEHSLNQSRLEQEREERRRLHQELEGAQGRKQQLLKQIEGLKETLLVEIPRQAQDLHDCARGIEDKLTPPTAAASTTTALLLDAGSDAAAAPIESSKPGWAGLSAEELASLPTGLHMLLGRIVGYMEALDPETARRRLSCEVVSSADHAAKHGLPVLAEEGADTEQQAMDVDDDDTTTAADGAAGNGKGGGGAAALAVSPRAVCLRVLFGEDDLMPAAGGGGAAAFSVFFYFSPASRLTLAHCPEDPAALLNLMPMDTGDSASNAAVRGVIKLGEEWQGPRPFRWAQWLSGSVPFPAAEAVLSPEYSSACLLDRLVVRLRARRILDQQLQQLQADTPVLAVDPTPTSAGLFQDLGPGERQWEVTKCVELTRATLSPLKHLFDQDDAADDGGGGDEAAVVAAPTTELAAEEQEGGGSGAWEGWAQFGARYLEVTCSSPSSSHRKASSIKAYFQIPTEYPVRPPRVRIVTSSSSTTTSSSSSSSSSGGKKSSSSSATTTSTTTTNVNPCKNMEVEVNVHYGEVLGDHPMAHDWLLPHQIRRLVMCLNATDNTTQISGVGQRRWGKDRRKCYSMDVQARFFMPR